MNITVQKYDPSTDSAPYEVCGEVPWKENMTALEALMYFHENIEAVHFDQNCVCRLCGRCAMMLDDVPRLVCVTPIEDEDHTFKPLEGYPILRDLIVDKEILAAQISTASARTRVEPFTSETLKTPEWPKEDRDLAYALEFCARCGVCTTACPSHKAYPDEFAGPAVMAAISYRFLDPLDKKDRVMEAVNAGLYRCVECGTCDIVCPQQDIEHATLWKKLRAAAQERGIVPSYAEKTAEQADEIVSKYGLVSAVAAKGSSALPNCSNCHDDGRQPGDDNPHGLS